jgi:hypothetical protein
MRTDCTKLLLKYRDITRLIWNAAFWTNSELEQGSCFVVGDYMATFADAAARLYEGMVLLPLGNASRVDDVNYPGKTGLLSIEVGSAGVECLIDDNLPGDAGHVWRRAGLALDEGGYEFEFRSFFDWDQLGHRDFLYIEVLIRRLDQRPEAVGHHALIQVVDCTAWAVTAARERVLV